MDPLSSPRHTSRSQHIATDETFCLPIITIPRDADGYVLSFDARSEDEVTLHSLTEFFDTFGFVVVRDVFDIHECEATRSVMWDILEQGSKAKEDSATFRRDNPRTWHLLKAAGRYGLSTRGPCFQPILVQNRQNIYLARILARILDTEASDVMVSHDRFTLYRSTRFDDASIDGAKFSNGKRNVHLDLNPWW